MSASSTSSLSPKQLLRKHILQLSRSVCKQNPTWRSEQSMILCEKLLTQCQSAKNIGLYLPLYFEIDVEPLIKKLLPLHSEHDEHRRVFVPELFPDGNDDDGNGDDKTGKQKLSMRFVQVLSAEDLAENFKPVPPYNIREPPKAEEDGKNIKRIRFDAQENPTALHLDVMIVPGVAFDFKCNRLGKGGGFYDRWISSSQENPGKSKQTKFIGVGFDEQMPLLQNRNEGVSSVSSWWTMNDDKEKEQEKEIPVDPWDRSLDMIVTPSFSVLRSQLK